MNIFSSIRSIFILSALKDPPLHSAFVVKNLACYYKYSIRYGTIYLKNLGNFFATRWLIFADPVTFRSIIMPVVSSSVSCVDILDRLSVSANIRKSILVDRNISKISYRCITNE